MDSTNMKRISDAKHTQAMYNMVPNLVWSILNLVPISLYCYSLLEPRLFWIFLGVSLIFIFLPNKMLDRLGIGKSRRIYMRLGVQWVNKVAQNGALVNHWVRKKYPDHKTVTPDRGSVAKLIRQSYMFEKFHLVCFVFFLCVNVHAVVKGHWGWAIAIFLANMAYNVYPNLLQQHIRVRLKSFRSNGQSP